MGIAPRQWATLCYLVLVLGLGGASAAGFAANLVLQLVGAGLIAWTLWSDGWDEGLSTGLKPFLLGLAALAALQFVPLPPMIWQLLPGRDEVARGFELAGVAKPWLNFSLDPWGALQSLTWWIPALALLMAVRAHKSPETRHIVWVVLAVAYGSVGFAAVQAMSGSGYIYSITNQGNGVGLFSNSNHFGSFMLMAMALAAGQWLHERDVRRPLAPWLHPYLELTARLAPFAVGVFLSNSLACALLMIPIGAGIALMVFPSIKIRWPVVAVFAAAFGVGIVWLLTSGLVSNDMMSKSGTLGISRGEFLANGLAILQDFHLAGSGLGTFRELYPWYEAATNVSTTYANHAHNDLLELIIEAGLPGLIVLAMFLRWFVQQAWSLWNYARTQNPVALAATLAVISVLIHSLVDYPLRTGAISGLIAICCILICRPPALRGFAARAQSAPGAGKRETMLQI